ncbi:MAG: hypothetical protein CO099_06145 [Bdellovibrio sp. CG_4_9_14_3_um_filter_39_7]|nr:MAG: hypothetical protein CO099_06145 [Bdellovibrio sp. CG_4_9_14_3_um_filter_39_7]
MEVDLIELDSATALTAFTQDGGLDPFVLEIKNMVESFEHDLTTATGRKKTASLAAKVSKFKVYLDETGKSLTEDWKAKSKVVDQSRKKIRDELDALRDEARKPLTQWEQAEQARVDRIKTSINDIKNVDVYGIDALKQRLEYVKSLDISETYYLEYFAMAIGAQNSAIESLNATLKIEEERELQRLELEKLRAESEARAKSDREEALRKEGELRAQREAEEKIKAEQERAEAEKKEAIAEAERKELQARRQAEQSELEYKESIAKAEQAQREAEAKAARAENEARAKIEAEKQVEIKRIEALEANKAHNKKIKSESKADLIALGCSEEMAIKIIIAIDEKKIRNLSIKY